jgi:hypothetical protein
LTVRAHTRQWWGTSGRNLVEKERNHHEEDRESVLALTVIATVIVTRANAADPIADLNAISEKAVKTVGHAPPVAALDFAIVHLAIHDAVESIDRRYSPYHAFVPSATGESAGGDRQIVMYEVEFRDARLPRQIQLVWMSHTDFTSVNREHLGGLCFPHENRLHPTFPLYVCTVVPKIPDFG